MTRRISLWCGAAVVAALFVLPSSRAAAQVVITNGGMSVNGVDLSAYGGVASVEVVDSVGVTGGFTAGVVGPYPLGWGGGYPVYGALPAYGGFYTGGTLPGGGFYGGGFGYGYGYRPFWGGPVALPPIILPAETMYGPGPVRRMMGLDPPLGTPIVNRTTIVTPAPQNNNFGFGVNAQPAANGTKVPPPPNVVATNQATKQRARKQIDAGDAAFQQQRFAEAAAEYKEATRIAPDMPETYVRQAAADIALQRYDDAVTALKTALRLQPTLVDAPFRFSALYGAANLTRQQHLQALADLVGTRPSSDLLFLYGAALYFDDPPQRAAPIFARARALAVGSTWYIDLFQTALDQLPADAGPQPVDAAKPVLPMGNPAQAPADNGARDI